MMDQNVIYKHGNLNKLATYINRSLHADLVEPSGASEVPEEIVQELMEVLISQ
jgi:hypothetical protein